MKKFSELNIEIKQKTFIGDKIKIHKIINKDIIVNGFEITDSKIFKTNGNDKCLCLEFTLTETTQNHIVFTSSKYLIEAITQIKHTDLPFQTKIVEKGRNYIFT